jgi:hypothetical protein
MAESTSSVDVPRSRRWSSQRQLSDEVGECVLPAMNGHSPRGPARHSIAGFAPLAAAHRLSINLDDATAGANSFDRHGYDDPAMIRTAPVSNGSRNDPVQDVES